MPHAEPQNIPADLLRQLLNAQNRTNELLEILIAIQTSDDDNPDEESPNCYLDGTPID